MGVAAESPVSIRPRQAAERYGLSLATVWREVRSGRIRNRKAGRATLLCAEDCERLWGGWSERLPEPSPAAVEFVDRIVGEGW